MTVSGPQRPRLAFIVSLFMATAACGDIGVFNEVHSYECAEHAQSHSKVLSQNDIKHELSGDTIAFAQSDQNAVVQSVYHTTNFAFPRDHIRSFFDVVELRDAWVNTLMEMKVPYRLDPCNPLEVLWLQKDQEHHRAILGRYLETAPKLNQYWEFSEREHLEEFVQQLSSLSTIYSATEGFKNSVSWRPNNADEKKLLKKKIEALEGITLP